jgi:Leucine-rich repeat (LRR) protein
MLLEELLLARNRIKKIENVDHLYFLKKLELGTNQISSVSGIANLNNLMELSIEDC